MDAASALAVLLSLAAPGAEARVLLTQKQALELAFPGAAPARRTAYLTDAQAREAAALAKAKVDSKVWSYYAGPSTGPAAGFAWFDRVVVRTMPATVMAVVNPDGTLRFLEVLSFDEPDDYRASPRWLEQLKGKALGPDLRVGGLLRNMTGATLTSAALAEASRRLLALHAVVRPAAAP